MGLCQSLAACDHFSAAVDDTRQAGAKWEGRVVVVVGGGKGEEGFNLGHLSLKGGHELSFGGRRF